LRIEQVAVHDALERFAAVVDVATGKVRSLLKLAYAPTAAWSPDSSGLVANSVPKSQRCWSTWRVPVDGSKPTLISSCTR
jgi:hypothetical protein